MIPIIQTMLKEIVNAGIDFDYNGLPMLPTEMQIKNIPLEMFPYKQRALASKPECTVICAFSQDTLLEQRIRCLRENLIEYKAYMGVTGFDLSIRIGMSLEEQLRIAKINKIIDCYFAINGIKVLPNFRVGDVASIPTILNYSKGSAYAVGVIGCKRGASYIDEAILRAKILYARPSRLLLYGEPKKNGFRILRDMGTPFNVYKDFRKRSFAGEFKDGQ